MLSFFISLFHIYPDDCLSVSASAAVLSSLCHVSAGCRDNYSKPANYTEEPRTSLPAPLLSSLTLSFCVTSGSARSRTVAQYLTVSGDFLAPSSSIIKANGARYFEPAIWAPLISDLKTIAGDWATPSGHLQWPEEFSWEATEHCSSIPQSCGFFRRQFAIYAAICNLFLNGKT